MQSPLNTQNPNNYLFDTKHLKIQVLGGIRFNNLEAILDGRKIEDVDNNFLLIDLK